MLGADVETGGVFDPLGLAKVRFPPFLKDPSAKTPNPESHTHALIKHCSLH